MAGGSKFAKLGAQLADLQARRRGAPPGCRDALCSRRFASAIAMGVYSLEIHLKVRICKRLNLEALPKPFEIHDLEGLLVLSGLQAARDSASRLLQKKLGGSRRPVSANQ